MDKLIISGNDNYGNPKQNFADKLARLSDDDFVREAEDHIWLSAYANNNPRSDYHWQADSCYDEAKRRGNTELYNTAYWRAASTS